MKHTPMKCINWNGSIDSDGYGRISINGKSKLVHRVEYEKHNEPIPKGLVIDHLCRNRKCINTKHMEVVTPVENTMRGFNPCANNARKTHCKRDHELSNGNLILDYRGHRQCKQCRHDSWNAYRARKIKDRTWTRT